MEIIIAVWLLIGLITTAWIFIEVLNEKPNCKWKREDYIFVPIISLLMILFGPIVLVMYLHNRRTS